MRSSEKPPGLRSAGSRMPKKSSWGVASSVARARSRTAESFGLPESRHVVLLVLMKISSCDSAPVAAPVRPGVTRSCAARHGGPEVGCLIGCGLGGLYGARDSSAHGTVVAAVL